MEAMEGSVDQPIMEQLTLTRLRRPNAIKNTHAQIT
jgi:hypothetical protein